MIKRAIIAGRVGGRYKLSKKDALLIKFELHTGSKSITMNEDVEIEPLLLTL